jgi:hypothetical protein
MSSSYLILFMFFLFQSELTTYYLDHVDGISSALVIYQ